LFNVEVASSRLLDVATISKLKSGKMPLLRYDAFNTRIGSTQVEAGR
jgi:hypothetical protein